MAIPIEGMVGYIRSRPKRNGPPKKGPDGKPLPAELELWIDQTVLLTTTPTGPVVSKPADCTGILYSVNGKLVVEYPEV
ncbi:hypothetical protein [Frigoriglobus tundricola]|uniref:Uncharacterized protein n=1 Tax=Frigoriglobus tundricola TaxID=2774151 RepID=A0A6M5YXR2_9BACT|nr:hypothetical protein [Frigoriglobus tundricola]QJW98688.1 hypothetical protein FTUN_6283 [Frigoriglobus tundricola]